MVLPFHTRTACPCLWTLSFTPPVRQPLPIPYCQNPFVSERGHHRICSKSYSKDSGMILRLDVAVERRRRARPVWRAALCGQHTALEQVTERIRGIIPILATRTDLRVHRKRCPTSCSPTSLRSTGTHRLQRRLGLAIRTAQTEVVGPAKLRSAFLDAAYRTI